MQIIKEITLDLNRATTNVVGLEVRQGDKDGRFIKAYIETDGVVFEIPETLSALVSGAIKKTVVAEDITCEINRTENRHFVLIPITAMMCAQYGKLELVLKFKEGTAEVSAQSIWVDVVADIVDNSAENLYAPINATNEVLAKVVEGNGETLTGLDTYRLNRLEPILEETKGALTAKGVEITEPFVLDNVPQAIESVETDGEFKELAETYKTQAETEKQRADEAVAEAEAEKTRANEAALRAENAEEQAEAYREQAETATTEANAAKAEAEAEKARAGIAEGKVIGLIDRNITEVNIPVGIKELGKYAFGYCEDLETVIIPDGVITIGEYAFTYCSGLSHLIIPDSVKSIKQAAFAYCSGLSHLIIPDSVTEIIGYAFQHCTGLKNVTISNSVTAINGYVFHDCKSLESITIPNNVTLIGDFSFFDCKSLKSVTIPNSATTVGQAAFRNCTALEIITVEQGFNCSLNISYSTLYSVETLVAMLEALADLTGQTAKTLTIGETNLAKLTEEQIAIATNKNWTLA